MITGQKRKLKKKNINIKDEIDAQNFSFKNSNVGKFIHDNNINIININNNKNKQGKKEEKEKRKKEEKDIISQDRFNKIKNKLEEDYAISTLGWSDEELKKIIENNLNDDLNNLFYNDEDEAISKIVEMIGEAILEL